MNPLHPHSPKPAALRWAVVAGLIFMTGLGMVLLFLLTLGTRNSAFYERNFALLVSINVAAAVETARRLGPGHTIVTVLCDSGDRYRSRLYDDAWLSGKGLRQPVRAA